MSPSGRRGERRLTSSTTRTEVLPSAVLASQGHQIERLAEQDEGPLVGYFDLLPIPVLRLPPNVVTGRMTCACPASTISAWKSKRANRRRTICLSKGSS
jgi:hypothetical protein